MLVAILRLISLFILLGGVALLIREFYLRAMHAHSEVRPVLPTALFIFGLITLVLLSGAAQISPTHIGVVENTWTGRFFVLEPGTHIWPFESRLVPLVTRVYSYNLRRQKITIGDQPVREKGVQADSNSPGRPVVYFFARGWASPNKERIIDLHRLYGEDYLDEWVERVWLSSLKAVQGDRPYDYVGNKRPDFQDEVERALQKQLVDENGESLVFVSQLAVVDFDFSDEINSYLDTVAEKEFERQQSEQQILVNQKKQEAQTIEADTKYLVKKRNAEASRVERVTTAEGQAEAKRLLADADAYEIRAQKEAEAEGISAVQKAIATAPDAYIDYLRATQWNGRLPEMMLGSSPVPFLSLPFPEDISELPQSTPE